MELGAGSLCALHLPDKSVCFSCRTFSYVDNQLRTSKRFDAEGIEREHPHLFLPTPKRRSSSGTSISTMASDVKQEKERTRDTVKEQGMLRYWTSDMCSRTPELFDFVVTVSAHFACFFFIIFMNIFFSSVVTALSCLLHGFSNALSHQFFPSPSAHLVS